MASIIMLPCKRLTHLSPGVIFTPLRQTHSVTQGQPSAFWQLKVCGGQIWWKAVEILIWVCPVGQCGLPPFPGEASSSPSPLWTLNRRHWRGSAYERAHSLLPTEFIKFFFFPYQCGQYFFHCLPPTFQAQEVRLLGCHLTGGRWFTKQEALTSKLCFHSTGGESRVLDPHYWCWESGEQCWKHSLTYLLWLGKSL